MLNIKPKIAFTYILEDVLPPTAISGHFDRYRKKHCSELTAILYKTVSILLSEAWILLADVLSSNDIAIAAGSLGFVPWACQIGHS